MILRSCRFGVAAFAAVIFLHGALAAEPDDDDAPTAAQNQPGALPTLNAEQQRAAGVVVAHPVKSDAAQRNDAIGLVLDPVALITDAGEVDATAAAARASGAEVERVRGLYGAGAGASLKALQAAQSEQARARAQADAAAAKFAVHWRAVAGLASAARQKLIERLTAGTALLIRADLPGRHAIGSLPESAVVAVDGIAVAAKVLGAATPAEEAQSAGVLIEVQNPPAGLGPGARVPVTLAGGAHSGLVVPRDCVLYDEGGALVYKQLHKKVGDPATHYAPVRVTLLQQQGDGWLVEGIDDDDDIVIHGAGVLWSLQGIVGHAAGDNDDD